MLQYPAINPIAVSLGPLKIHWYGIMYLIGFAAAWWLCSRRARRSNGAWTSEQVSDLIFYVAIGLVIGGRVGYMLFYDWSGLMAKPLSLFMVWQGGMSFHGGCLGGIVGAWLFSRREKKQLFQVTDFYIPMVPIGLGAGRLGNFINDELWGRVSHVPWAMVFPSGGPLARHPSQIYEFLLEGVLLFLILYIYSMKKRPLGAVSGWFLVLYAGFRFFVEFFRQPDAPIGFVSFGLTRGQELCIPMFILGLIVLFLAYRQPFKQEK